MGWPTRRIPAQWRCRTIGGNIATNAGGMCCVKYGVTREYVREIKVVLADGTLTTLGHRTIKGVAGLDLVGLLTGSEGTLGVIVGVTVKLVPAGPAPLSALATFPTVRAATETVTAYMATGATPSMLEMMDGMTIGMISEIGDFGLDASVGAVLIMQSDSVTAAADTEAFAAVAEEHGQRTSPSPTTPPTPICWSPPAGRYRSPMSTTPAPTAVGR